MDDELRERLVLAAGTLSERQCAIMGLRYGWADGDAHRLGEIGRHYGVSRERIRQLLSSAGRRMTYFAKRSMLSGTKDDPCASLLLYLRELLRPDEPGILDRLWEHTHDDPPAVRSLILQLVGVAKDRWKECISDLAARRTT